jgi:putative ATP-binding cassette transporter
MSQYFFRMVMTPNTSPASPLEPDDKVSAWSLIKPYWVSEEWKIAWGLLIAIIVINLVNVWISVRFNTWSGEFFNMLQNKSVKDFPHLMLVWAGLVAALIVLFVYGRYLRQMLGFRWRQWLTTRYLQEWLGDGAFYRIERDRLADNPDQRISDDLQSFATSTLTLTLDLLSTVVTLITFVTILWSLAGALTVSLGGMPIVIPGYMVWVAALYALGGSYMIYKLGHPLVSITYQQQKVEADFRFGLIRVRENSEQIAFYDGEQTEEAATTGGA